MQEANEKSLDDDTLEKLISRIEGLETSVRKLKRDLDYESKVRAKIAERADDYYQMIVYLVIMSDMLFENPSLLSTTEGWPLQEKIVDLRNKIKRREGKLMTADEYFSGNGVSLKDLY